MFERQSWLKRFIPVALILFLAIGLALKAPQDSIYQYLALAVVLGSGMFTMGFLVKGLQEHGFTISGCLLTLLTIAVGIGILIGINMV